MAINRVNSNAFDDSFIAYNSHNSPTDKLEMLAEANNKEILSKGS